MAQGAEEAKETTGNWTGKKRRSSRRQWQQVQEELERTDVSFRDLRPSAAKEKRRRRPRRQWNANNSRTNSSL